MAPVIFLRFQSCILVRPLFGTLSWRSLQSFANASPHVYPAFYAAPYQQGEIDEARQLLDNLTPQSTILDVALKCGYDDQGSFGRAFKRFYGVTPSDYMAQTE